MIIVCVALLQQTVMANELDYPDTTYRSVDFVILDQETPPGPDTAWKPTSLPYQSSTNDQANFDNVSIHWIRLPLAAVSNHLNKSQAVYIWRHNIRLKMFLGDTLIGGTAENTLGKKTISWNTPLLIDLPPQLDSYLYIRIESGPSGALLSPIMLGDRDLLLPLFESRYFWQIEASKWASTLGIVLGFLSLWIWNNRKQDSLYWQFAAMSVTANLNFLFMFISFIPFELRSWLTVIHSAMDWGNYFLVLFTLNALDLKFPKFRNSMLVIAILATLSHLIVPDANFFDFAYSFLILETFGIMILVSIIFWQTFRHRNATRIWFSATFFGMIALVLSDFYTVFLSTPEELEVGSNVMQFSVPLIALAFFAHLISRFVHALNESEVLNSELENRIAQTRDKLEKSYASNRELELRQSAEKEREIIYRDLHDDVGSKLASIVHSSASSNDDYSVSLARSALESLRESIYRAKSRDQALDIFVGGAVEEVILRVESAGLSYTTKLHPDCDLILPAQFTYHLSRIIREVVTNTLHHSRASHFTVETRVEGRRFFLSLSDNGIGFQLTDKSTGGLNNIRYRAEKIGAEVHWHSDEDACNFTLQVDI